MPVFKALFFICGGHLLFRLKAAQLALGLPVVVPPVSF